MPKIYEYLGFVFSFFTNDHLPIHVHVRRGQKESKCELVYEESSLTLRWKKVQGKTPLESPDQNKAEDFIKKRHLQIRNKWVQVFVDNKAVKMEKVHKL